MLLGYFYWDPAREMCSFHLPFVDRPILWYGFFFALGFFLGYQVFVRLLKRYLAFFFSHSLARAFSQRLAEKLFFSAAIGALLGARLGDVLFYQNGKDCLTHPLKVFELWEGGLASHGGAVGILIALGWFSHRIRKQLPEVAPYLSWKVLLDFTSISAALAGGWIRIGNFYNQEVLGTFTQVPWAVIFGHPADGAPLLPRHPVQLYESLYYFFVFALLFSFGYRSLLRNKTLIPGKISGYFLLLVFTFRFFIEFLKVEQSVLLSSRFSYFAQGLSQGLSMGQWLSVPFLILGLWLILDKRDTRDLDQRVQR